MGHGPRGTSGGATLLTRAPGKVAEPQLMHAKVHRPCSVEHTRNDEGQGILDSTKKDCQPNLTERLGASHMKLEASASTAQKVAAKPNLNERLEASLLQFSAKIAQFSCCSLVPGALVNKAAPPEVPLGPCPMCH